MKTTKLKLILNKGYRNYFLIFGINLFLANTSTSCSSAAVGNPPVDNRSSKDVAIGKVTDAILGDTEQQIINNNQKLFEENQNIERKIKSNTNIDSTLNTDELLLLLKLNTNQKKVFNKSFDDYFASKSSIMGSLSIDDYEKQEKIMGLAKKRDELIMNILDSFQIEIFKNYLLKNQY